VAKSIQTKSMSSRYFIVTHTHGSKKTTGLIHSTRPPTKEEAIETLQLGYKPGRKGEKLDIKEEKLVYFKPNRVGRPRDGQRIRYFSNGWGIPIALVGVFRERTSTSYANIGGQRFIINDKCRLAKNGWEPAEIDRTPQTTQSKTHPWPSWQRVLKSLPHLGNTPISHLPLSAPIIRSLQHYGTNTLSDLGERNALELTHRDFGAKSVCKVAKAIQAFLDCCAKGEHVDWHKAIPVDRI
jgi:hypothetical protein